jgi:hypothetical protein
VVKPRLLVITPSGDSFETGGGSWVQPPVRQTNADT